MKTFKLFISVLTVLGIVGILFLQVTGSLTAVIILLLLWLSFLLLSISFPTYQWVFLGCQLGIALVAPFVQTWLFYLLPGTVANFLVLGKYQPFSAMIGSILLVSYGIYLPDRYMQLGGLLWTVFVFFVYLTVEKLTQEKRGLSDSSDMLRIERNRLSTLFEQSVMNSEAREKEAVLSERQRLVHEIHDELGHKLSGGLIQMEAAKAVYHSNPQQAEELLAQAIATTREGINDIRKTLHSEAPPVETLNINRIKTELQTFMQRYQIKTSFQYFGKVDQLSNFQWQVLLGNLKETLTNTLKYAEASEVSVKLHVFKGFLRFEVSNNGKQAVTYKKGLGILGMEERTAMLSGQLLIDSSHNFTVTTILPIQQHEKSHV
ncbi:sensor histidine kinase [Enterococcus songbeiensis]|uniref:sensor histidine kinase n=1 Tax=Enterococcus songbeiensis TaxID=2559927 RepID=UPI0014851901|nr:histidine kinase [Enterococcus songbeiensis]